jgi:predicted ATPase
VRHYSHAFLYGQDPGVFCLALAAWDLCLLGYPDQALKRNQEALTVAREVVHPLSLAAAQAFFALTHQVRREGQAAQEHAEAAVELSSEQGFPFFLAFGTILIGWSLTEQGQIEEGIVQLRRGLAAYRATGAELAMTRFVALLAQTLGKAGHPEEGLNVLAEALAMVNNNGERDNEAELYRLRGELTLAQSRVQSLGSRVQTNQKAKSKEQKAKITNSLPLAPNTQREVKQEAEGCFLKAVDIARRQQAKSMELRAVMSLVRLRQQQVTQATRDTRYATRSRLYEAHRMLAEVYHWFTEGFETKDLQEAKALLDDLG